MVGNGLGTKVSTPDRFRSIGRPEVLLANEQERTEITAIDPATGKERRGLDSGTMATSEASTTSPERPVLERELCIATFLPGMH